MINYTKVAGKNFGDIKLYALSTCGWCKKTKQFLDENGIEYSYVYVDKIDGEELDECLSVQKIYSSEEAYPMVTIGANECIVGYDREKLEKILG